MRTFVLGVANVFRRVARGRGEDFVDGVDASVLPKEIVPATVRWLGGSAGVVVPSCERIASHWVNGVCRVGLFLVNRYSGPGAVVGVTRRPRLGVVLGVGLGSFVLAYAFGCAFCAAFVVCEGYEVD